MGGRMIAGGLAGIASFHEAVATRILLLNSAGLALLIGLVGVVIGIRLGSSLAIPGWASYAVGILLILFTQLAASSFNLVFSLIVNRGSATVIPIRDYRYFIESVQSVGTEGGRSVHL